VTRPSLYFKEQKIMSKAIVLYSGQIAESWSCILENLHGNANAARLYRSTAAYILSCHIPEIYIERTRVKPSDWSKLEREHLLVTNHRLRAQIFIGSYDYGNNLAISWYLVLSAPDLFTSLSAGHRNLFQQQELKAFVAVIHRCVRQAIVELLLSFGQEPSQLEATSTGFLGVES
jgi:hypothetical protein